MTCETCTTLEDILHYIQDACRPVSSIELAEKFSSPTSKICTKCGKLVKQGYLEHPTPNTWVATGTPNCVLCHGPISPYFFVTLNNGAKVCDCCIFAKLDESREAAQ